MRYYSGLYVGEGIEHRVNKIKKQLENGIFRPGIFLLVLSEKKEEQLEIFTASMLLQDLFKKRDYFIVGIAGSYTEALELVKVILEEVYAKTNTGDIKSYLMVQK